MPDTKWIWIAIALILSGCASPVSFYAPGQGPSYDPLIANAVRAEEHR